MVEHKKQLPVYSDTSGCLLIQVGIKYDVMVVRTVRVCGALEAGEGTDTAGQRDSRHAASWAWVTHKP